MTEQANDLVVATLVGDEDWVEIEPFLEGLIESKRDHADLIAAFASELPTRSARRELQRFCSQLRAGDDASVVFDDGNRITPPVISLLTLELDSLPDEDANCFIGNLTGAANTAQAITRTFNYPAIFFGILAVYGLFVFHYLLPIFGNIYDDFELPLPAMTAMLFRISRYASMVCVLVAGNLALWFLRKIVIPQSLRMELAVRIPIFGKLYRHAYASRFCDVASVLLRSKSPFTACLRVAGRATLPRSLASQIDSMTLNSVALPMNWVAVQRYGLPRRLCVALASLSQRESVERLLVEFGEDFRVRASAPSSRVFEPICIIVLGVAAGFVVISLMLPLVALIQNLSG